MLSTPTAARGHHRSLLLLHLYPPPLSHRCCPSRSIQQQYFSEVERISFKLLEAFALGLGLAPRALHPLFDTQHTSFLRLNYYPVTPGAPPDALGISDHKDAGFLTVLLQDEVPGLQVRAPNKC